MAAEVETKVKIKADARDLQKLRREGKQAFDKSTLREFTRSAGDLERQLGAVLKRQIRLTDELKKVEKGTKAYKALKDELKGINSEATMVERTLGRVRQVLQKQQQDQDRSRQRRQGFVGGMAQGMGVAEYMPTGAEQAPRMGGAMLGRGIRRAGRAVSAPFVTPGVAGMAQGFAGIPIVGGFIGGALQTAAGMYQQAVGFQRQQRGMLAYQGAQAGQLVTGQRRGAGANLELARQEMEAAQEQQRLATGQQGPAAMAAREAQRAVRAGAAARRGVSERDLIRMENQEAILRPRGQFGAMTRGVARPRQEIGVAENRLARANVMKGTQADKEAAETRLKDAKEGLRRAQVWAKPTTRRLTGLPGAGAGVRFGIGPQEMNQLFGQMMGARGGTYGDVERQQFTEAMAAQTAYGVTGQQAGQFARMGIRGGGGRGMGQGLAGVLQAAVAQGLRGSQVTEHLQSLVQLGQQAERSGVKINVREFTRGAATLTAAGLQGLQAQRVATGMQQAAMTVSQRGVTSPVDVLLARAAGFDPSQGPEGYARAMNKMAGGMTTDMMNKLMANMSKGAEAGGFGPEMQALMLRRAMGRMGVQIGPGQATRLLESYRGGEGDIETMLQTAAGQEMIGAGERPGARGRLTRIAERKVRFGAPLTRGAAGLEAFQIGVGARAAKWVLPLERASARAAGAISRLPIDRFANAVERATVALDKLMSPGTEEGFLDSLKILVNSIRGKKTPGLPGT